ncbi:MAG: pimeloyl-ACP methyl ester carboxylesterase [Cocleimonas sp.]|jgi:pimeloyl-ACP methyl ester carboxylesterase
MKTMAKRLVAAGFNVQQVGYKSLGETPELVLKDITEQINACCAKLATPVHLVGHSLGGVLARAYLGNNSLPSLKSVVLIGSPNKSTPVVDAFKESWWMKVAGDVALSLNTENKGFLNNLKAPNYPLGVIAGVVNEGRLFSDDIPGDDDGLVPLESTKVEGMNDFIILHVGHGKMRDDETVMAQLLHYVKEGKFQN